MRRPGAPHETGLVADRQRAVGERRAAGRRPRRRCPVRVGVQHGPGVHEVVGEQHDPGDREDPPRRAVAGGQQREARDELRHVRAPHRVLAEEHDERWRRPTRGAARRATSSRARRAGRPPVGAATTAPSARTAATSTMASRSPIVLRTLAEVGAGRAIGGDLEVVAVRLVPHVRRRPTAARARRWKPMAVAAPATIGASRRPASSTRAAGTITGRQQRLHRHGGADAEADPHGSPDGHLVAATAGPSPSSRWRRPARRRRRRAAR